MPHKDIVEAITGDCKPGYCLLRELLNYSKEKVPEHDERSCCYRTSDCPLKEKILKMKLTDKTLIQMKCVEIFKYEKSNQLDSDIGWNGAWKLWRDEGHASSFSRQYHEGLEPREIYEAIMREERSSLAQI